MIPNQKHTLSCCPLVPSGQGCSCCVRELRRGCRSPLSPESAAGTRPPCSRWVLSQTKCSGFQWIMLTCLTLHERYSHSQCQLCHLQNSLMTVCGLRQLQKGHLRAHKVEAWGTKFKAEVLYGQCVWSGPAFLGGEAETRAGVPQELSWLDLQEELSSFWPQTMFWATHQHSASEVRELCSLPIAQWLSWAPRAVTKAPCSQVLWDSDHSPAPWNQWDSGHSPDSSPSYINTLSFRSTDFSDWSCQALDLHEGIARPKEMEAATPGAQELQSQESLCLPHA